jgi:uncharacterized membrane protein YphA (DoxX/SURF4 family)
MIAGLAVVVALFVGFATNKWQLRVLFLLALRLAIGWHFLFEGLHKIHSHEVGATDSSRPFTSEPYFTAAEGPIGGYMRKTLVGDPEARIAARLTPTEPGGVKPADFQKLSAAEQAKHCPDAVAKELDAAITDVGKAEAAKAAYARWVYGVDARDAKVKFIEQDVPLGVPARLEIIAVLKKQIDELSARDVVGLGNGYGYEQKRLQGAKADLRAAETSLLTDADKFVDTLKAAAGAPAATDGPAKPYEKLDRITMWTITVVGACLLLGLFTPIASLVGAGFLLMTYLSHPTVPWLPLPPGTEGNPLFINKNIIEMLALLVVAVHPTGRWLGLDALLTRLFCRRCA